MEFHPIDKPTGDAQILVPLLINRYHPRSVADFGCNQGAYLAEFLRQGVRIFGIDGDNMRSVLLIPETSFASRDLREPLDLGERFDLALCIEVGEHLPDSASETLVDTLCRHSSTIIFGAAHPGQGGYEHINEQPLEYW